MMDSRDLWRIGRAAVWAGLLAGGCARVDPQPDYSRANQLISERTGVEDIYDPAAEAHVQTKIDQLLTDGLTVEKAIRVALLNNRGFQALFAAIGASRADVVQSGLLTNPSLSLSGQLPDGGGRAKLNAGFAQQIADFWQIPVRRKVAEAELEQTIFTAAHRATDLAADVKVRCYRLLALQQAERHTRESIKLAEEGVQLALAKLAAGQVNQLDVNLTRATAIDANLQLLALQREQRVAEAELARVLGINRRPGAWTLNDALPAGGFAQNTETLLAAALERRFDVRAAVAQVEAGENELQRQLVRTFPDLAIGFDFERPDAQALPGRKLRADTARSSLAAGQLAAPDIQSRGQRNIEKSLIVDSLLGPSLMLTLPLWDQNQAQVIKARFRVLQKQKELEDLLDSVAQDVQRAAAQAQGAGELVRYYEQEALPRASENVTTATKIYEAGEEDILPLLDSERSLLERRLAYTNALRDHAIALAELENAVGGRLPTGTAALLPDSNPAQKVPGK